MAGKGRIKVTGLAKNVKDDLAYLYETDEFKSVKRWFASKKEKAAKRLLSVDPRDVASIAMVQAQLLNLEMILKEWQLIHNETVESAVLEERRGKDKK